MLNHPKTLVLALGRINNMDNSNNGLLLRNLFDTWPKEKLAQIYSSGDNGDRGFFGSYYQLGSQDRRLGRLFYKMKTNVQSQNGEMQIPASEAIQSAKNTPLKLPIKRFFVASGLYEIIFRPRVSDEMLKWIEDFQPEVIFAQGYNLTFAWLPVMLRNHLRIPLIYYPTDDWPSDLYRIKRPSFYISYISSRTRRKVAQSEQDLVNVAEVRIAFNDLMQKEYLDRYEKEFFVLMHGDHFSRFEKVKAQSKINNECLVVSTGVFNSHRYPLLQDLDRACDILQGKGMNVRAEIYPVNPKPAALFTKDSFQHIEFKECPTHDDLVSRLRTADVLFLPERFDDTSEDVRLCISSKAHLFMFSGRPIIVYAKSVTGVAGYAAKEGWAVVVDSRDPLMLAKEIEKLYTNMVYSKQIIMSAKETAKKNHNLESIQKSFLEKVNLMIEQGGLS